MSLRAVPQGPHELIDVGWIELRLISLDVDDQVGVLTAAGDDFADPVGSARMLARQLTAGAETAGDGGDFLAVGCDQDLCQFRRAAGGFPDVLQQGLTGLRQQQLTGQTR